MPSLVENRSTRVDRLDSKLSELLMKLKNASKLLDSRRAESVIVFKLGTLSFESSDKLASWLTELNNGSSMLTEIIR